ncbi:DUF2889 domain-containing protein [Novosphingobium sp. KCTC 2891]|uniref:DUF2889 domain-containing protein n=1 Tax=Novosphingobium sp. KCTC 2891 TaxID=2989730 RepID=UPI00222377D5|nr:DUF2889 domain-containing protein [Novosphingobium sp. KCTC 2891]MCW1383177.1 DUF2889 domain-containing protein [Novosphingobium sp. KCTC 2891]
MSHEGEPGTAGLDLGGQPLPVWPAAPSAPVGFAPPRRAGSVRRTMTLEATWPGGVLGPTIIAGHCRDAFTADPARAPAVLAEDRLTVSAQERTIVHLTAEPPHPELAALEGTRPGGKFRATLNEALPGEREAGTPLYLLLDDLAGATLVARWAWSRWFPGWATAPTEEGRKAHAAGMLGACTGLRPGSSGIVDQGAPTLGQNTSAVGPLANPADPDGWHPLTDLTDEIQFRRARRIDAWMEGDTIRIDTHFQDSANTREGGRTALHEYHLTAEADARTGLLTRIEAHAGTLPYPECPGAMSNLRFLVGTPLTELRARVLQMLRRTNGCTHLNDVVRSLAEVPAMLSRIPEETTAP